MAGVGLMLVLDVFSAGAVDGLGVVWALLAMAGCAFFFVVSASDEDVLPPIVLAAGGLVVGAIALAVAGALRLVPFTASTDDAVYRGASVPWWLPVLALGVITAALAYVAGILAARGLGARMASFAALLEVLFARGLRLAAARPAAPVWSSCSAVCSCWPASCWSSSASLVGD